MSHVVFRSGSRPGVAHQAHSHTGENQRFCDGLHRSGIPLREGLGVVGAFFQSLLHENGRFFAVIFVKELTGEPPVAQSGVFADDVSKASGEHGHGSVLENVHIGDDGSRIHGGQRGLDSVQDHGGHRGGIAVHGGRCGGDHIGYAGAGADVLGQIVECARAHCQQHVVLGFHSCQGRTQGVFIGNQGCCGLK